MHRGGGPGAHESLFVGAASPSVLAASAARTGIALWAAAGPGCPGAASSAELGEEVETPNEGVED